MFLELEFSLTVNIYVDICHAVPPTINMVAKNRTHLRIELNSQIASIKFTPRRTNSILQWQHCRDYVTERIFLQRFMNTMQFNVHNGILAISFMSEACCEHYDVHAVVSVECMQTAYKTVACSYLLLLHSWTFCTPTPLSALHRILVSFCWRDSKCTFWPPWYVFVPYFLMNVFSKQSL